MSFIDDTLEIRPGMTSGDYPTLSEQDLLYIEISKEIDEPVEDIMQSPMSSITEPLTVFTDLPMFTSPINIISTPLSQTAQPLSTPQPSTPLSSTSRSSIEPQTLAEPRDTPNLSKR